MVKCNSLSQCHAPGPEQAPNIQGCFEGRRSVLGSRGSSPPVVGRPAFPTWRSRANFWDMVMALADKLASFNVVVETLGLEQDWCPEGGGSKGKQVPSGQRLHNSKGGTSNTRAAAQDAASSI
jgi:hypothetical protein